MSPRAGCSRKWVRYEGCLHEHIVRNGRFEDLVLYGMLREDWEARQRET